MSRSRRKWVSGQARAWHIQWLDNATFKVELEGQGLNDKAMEEWSLYMDKQFEKSFGESSSEWPRLTASTLNFSKNELGDEGVGHIMDYCLRRDIAVQVLKLFENNIGDVGAAAVGQLMANSHTPMHEVHLSHNSVTDKGAFSLLTAIAQSKKYPYQADRSGTKDTHGMVPVWLRIEHNNVNWSAIESDLDQAQVRWGIGESHDQWTMPEDQLAPMVCLHTSYRSQDGPAGDNSPSNAEHSGNSLLTPLQGGVTQTPEASVAASASQTAEEVDVPVYIFLDASAVFKMARQEEGRLFSFKGLLSLCQKGLMTCLGRRVAPKEGERVIFMITDSVMDELDAFARSASDRKLIEWLRYAEDSYLDVHVAGCNGWGIVDVLDTKQHTQLMQLEAVHEQLGQDLRISHKSMKVVDFAYLWLSQIHSDNRVFFVTADSQLQRFAAEVGLLAKASGWRPLGVLNLDELDQRFHTDRMNGCRKIYEAVTKPRTAKSCNVVLSAVLMSAVIANPLVQAAAAAAGPPQRQVAESASSEADAEALRKELQEALALLGLARQHLIPGKADGQVARCLADMDDAQLRWQELLA